MKILSIIIPSYNSESYLNRCIESFINDDKILQALEIIIVNDGSTDNTSKIAHSWCKKFPQNITVIDKENGGHGSAINVGLVKATGKYFRVLDSDDWIKTENLPKYLSVLRKSCSDIVLTEYTRCEIHTQTYQTFKFTELEQKIAQPLKNINQLTRRADPINYLSIHTITIKTDVLKTAWQDGLLEKTFYEDQEYVAKAILAANTIEIHPIDFYQYFIGRADQSMSQSKLFQNRNQHAKVILKIATLANNCDNQTKKQILFKRLAQLYKTHYWIYYYHIGLNRTEQNEFLKFRQQLNKLCPGITKSATPYFRFRIFIGRSKHNLMQKIRKEKENGKI